MTPDQITSVDADGNVTITAVSTTTIEQLTKDRDGALQQVDQYRQVLEQYQGELTEAEVNLAAKQALVDAAEPLRATAIEEAQTLVQPALSTPEIAK